MLEVFKVRLRRFSCRFCLFRVWILEIEVQLDIIETHTDGHLVHILETKSGFTAEKKKRDSFERFAFAVSCLFVVITYFFLDVSKFFITKS